jgi:hypothetical protein
MVHQCLRQNAIVRFNGSGETFKLTNIDRSVGRVA